MEIKISFLYYCDYIKIIEYTFGGVSEWFMVVDLKSTVRSNAPGVRILSPPPFCDKCEPDPMFFAGEAFAFSFPLE